VIVFLKKKVLRVVLFPLLSETVIIVPFFLTTVCGDGLNDGVVLFSFTHKTTERIKSKQTRTR
jgi:hypothetical protein